MEYAKLVAVTGLNGLQELVSSKNDGAFVRSLEDKTLRFVSSRVHQLSHLETIEVFTKKLNVNLVEIFQAMEKHGTPPPTDQDPARLKAYFEKVYPDLDFERVYASDLKKMARWYLQLNTLKIPFELSAETETMDEPQQVAHPGKKQPEKKQVLKRQMEKKSTDKKTNIGKKNS